MHFESTLIYKVDTGYLTAFGKKELSFVYMKALPIDIYCRKPFLGTQSAKKAAFQITTIFVSFHGKNIYVKLFNISSSGKFFVQNRVS
jgi:hypothetical protein